MLTRHAPAVQYSSARVFAVLLFPGVRLLDVTGPAEVLATAAALGADYEVLLCSTCAGPVSTSAGTLLADASVDDLCAAPQSPHTLLVPGGADLGRAPVPPELAEQVRAMALVVERIASVCTGAFVLAETGLLLGRRATTHWQRAATLAAQHPGVTVEPDALYVRDGPVWTSAGVSAGIDLALALVEHDYGPDLARAVAREMVVFLRRPGGQSQFAASARTQRPVGSVLADAVESIHTDPAADHGLTALAARAAISPRHLGRLFGQQLGVTPAAYVETVRLHAAQELLEAGLTVSTAARRSGLGSDETLRRVFLRHLGVTPTAYRTHFSTTTPCPGVDTDHRAPLIPRAKR